MDDAGCEFDAEGEGGFVDDESGVVVAAGDADGFVTGAEPEVASGAGFEEE